MAKSLQDQLLKAGLVDTNQARKSKSDKRKQVQQQRKNKVAVTDQNKLQLEKARSEKIERDRQLNLQRQHQAEQKALAGQIKQLILTNRQELGKDGEAYNFVDQGKVKRLYISEDVRQQLTNGRLAIVKLDQQYELVPKPVAEKIKAHDATLVIVINDQNGHDSADDDAYADYQIPDDLMW